MKTKVETIHYFMNPRFIIFSLSMLLLINKSQAQENDSIQTLFRPNAEFSSIWAPELKINSIQGDIGTLIGVYGGVVIDRSFLLGLAGGVNLGHPRVNYGYFGGIGQYIYKPSNLIHCSGQLVLAYGSTKDYENPKSGLLDNFWNISGTSFFLLEPGLNVEINLKKTVSFVAGLSYRYVSGLNENSKSVSITHVTSKDMSGLNFNIGLKISKKKEPKK
jgi:hypothetical protein